MKKQFLLKKLNNLEKYILYIDGEKTEFSVNAEKWNSNLYYLVYEKNRLRGRFNTIKEVKEFLISNYLSSKAEKITGMK